jgi:hypothetical protein
VLTSCCRGSGPSGRVARCLSRCPVIKTAADVVTALGTVADLVGAGAVTPDEVAALAAIFESKRRAIETVDLEARLSALEQERK